MKKDPAVYLSKSEGRFRVICQGVPVSNDKATEAEALEAAKGLAVDSMAWDGDEGRWVERRTG